MTNPTEQVPPQDWKTDAEVVGWSIVRTALGIELRHAYTLTLVDGQVCYGCAYCPFTHRAFQGITARHLRDAHGLTGKNKQGAAGRARGHKQIAPELLDTTVREILALAADMQDRAKVDWRARALAAEKRLRDLRRALAE